MTKSTSYHPVGQWHDREIEGNHDLAVAAQWPRHVGASCHPSGQFSIDQVGDTGYIPSSKRSTTRRGPYARGLTQRGIGMATKNATSVTVSPIADRVVVRSL